MISCFLKLVNMFWTTFGYFTMCFIDSSCFWFLIIQKQNSNKINRILYVRDERVHGSAIIELHICKNTLGLCTAVSLFYSNFSDAIQTQNMMWQQYRLFKATTVRTSPKIWSIGKSKFKKMKRKYICVACYNCVCIAYTVSDAYIHVHTHTNKNDILSRSRQVLSLYTSSQLHCSRAI